ncbi:MAG: hypothetical protein Kow00124_21610 [Anaerolineae bacterium]
MSQPPDPASPPPFRPPPARESVRARLRAVRGRIRAHIDPVLRRWWDNALLRHARRLKPLNLHRLRLPLGLGAALLAAVTLTAWIARIRLLGAALIALSLAGAGLPVLLAPVSGAARVARQMAQPALDPRRLPDANRAAEGLVLVTLWRLRWPIIIALALTPALLIGVLRMDAASFTAWQDSAQALGGATPGARAAFLLPGGGIPYLRLILRALSAALLPWSLLPLTAAAGVLMALWLDDVGLSPLAALLAALIALPALLLLWSLLSMTPLLAGPLEIIRALLLMLFLAAPIGGAAALTRLSARLLTPPVAPLTPPEPPLD